MNPVWGSSNRRWEGRTRISKREEVPLLIQLIRRHQWEIGVELVKVNPEVAKDCLKLPSVLSELFRNEWAFNLAKAILEACPEVAFHINPNDGMSPLSWACRFGSFRLVPLCVNGQASRTPCTLTGSLPLHLMCAHQNIPHDSLLALLEANLDAVLCCNEGGVTPLEIFWDRHALNDEGECRLHIPLIKMAFAENQLLENHGVDTWDKFLIMVGGVSGVEAVGDHPSLPIHAMAAIDIPDSAMSSCLSIHENQWKELDSHGRTPLQVAIDNRKWSNVREILLKDPEQASIPLQETVRYPLHTLLEQQEGEDEGWQAVINMLHAFPDAASLVDPIRQLPPVFVAAAVGGGLGHGDIDAMYCMLQAGPSIIQCCIRD